MKLAQFGLDVKTVAATVRTAFAGTNATSVQDPESKLEYRVEIDDRYKNSEEFLMDLLIPNSRGNLVRLREIARLEKTKGMSSIRHYDGERSIAVTADINTAETTSLKANEEAILKLQHIPSKYPGTYLRFDGEYSQTNRALLDLALVFLGALVMIYLVVLVLFRSVGQPLIVMSVLPFGLIGVIIGFVLHGKSFDFMAMIGMIGLSGVVINDSIIMVDFINKVIRRKGETVSKIEEIIEGAGQRLRPIILTTVTTVVGLMPSVYGFGGDVDSFQSTVMAMAYGLLFATTLTLIFVPSLYMISLDIRGLLGLKSTV